MSTSRLVLAIIPARGGSKGIPKKNLQPLAGKPLIAYTIEQALAAPTISRVVVSTDSEEIADVARQYGAEVIPRPGSLSGDEATSEAALLHCMEYLRCREGYEPDLVVFLQATSPLRSKEDIERAVETLDREKADSLFSACPLHSFVWRVGSNGVAPVNYDPVSRPRRQEGPEHLAENGSIYVFKPWVLTSRRCRLGGAVSVYRMSALDSFQCDQPEDLPILEFLLRSRHSGQTAEGLER